MWWSNKPAKDVGRREESFEWGRGEWRHQDWRDVHEAGQRVDHVWKRDRRRRRRGRFKHWRRAGRTLHWRRKAGGVRRQSQPPGHSATGNSFHSISESGSELWAAHSNGGQLAAGLEQAAVASDGRQRFVSRSRPHSSAAGSRGSIWNLLRRDNRLSLSSPSRHFDVRRFKRNSDDSKSYNLTFIPRARIDWSFLCFSSTSSLISDQRAKQQRCQCSQSPPGFSKIGLAALGGFQRSGWRHYERSKLHQQRGQWQSPVSLLRLAGKCKPQKWSSEHTSEVPIVGRGSKGSVSLSAEFAAGGDRHHSRVRHRDDSDRTGQFVLGTFAAGRRGGRVSDGPEGRGRERGWTSSRRRNSGTKERKDSLRLFNQQRKRSDQ